MIKTSISRILPLALALACVLASVAIATDPATAPATAPAATAPATAPAVALDARQIQQLVKQLGDADVHVRDAAQKALAQVGEDAKLPLEAVMASDDLEVRERVTLILQAIYAAEFERNSKAIASSIIWSAAVKDGPVSPPAVVKGVVYAAGQADKKLHAYDLKSGKEKWNYGDFGNPIMLTRVLVSDGLAMVADSNNIVYAIDLETHELAWKAQSTAGTPAAQPGQPGWQPQQAQRKQIMRLINGGLQQIDIPTMLTAGGALVVSFKPEMGMQAYDLKSGKRAWKQDEAPSRIAADGDRLVCTKADGTLYVLNAKTGQKLFTASEKFSFNAMAVYDGVAYLRQTSLRAIDTKTGKELWNYDLPKVTDPTEMYRNMGWGMPTGVPDDASTFMAVDGQTAWILHGKDLLALDVKTGEKKSQWTLSIGDDDDDAGNPMNMQKNWAKIMARQQALAAAGNPTLTIDGTSAYICTSDGLSAVELKSGKQLWALPMANPVRGPVTIVDGLAVFAAVTPINMNGMVQPGGPGAPAAEEEKEQDKIVGVHAVRVAPKK